jgi:hypothetical protein
MALGVGCRCARSATTLRSADESVCNETSPLFRKGGVGPIPEIPRADRPGLPLEREQKVSAITSWREPDPRKPTVSDPRHVDVYVLGEVAHVGTGLRTAILPQHAHAFRSCRGPRSPSDPTQVTVSASRIRARRHGLTGNDVPAVGRRGDPGGSDRERAGEVLREQPGQRLSRVGQPRRQRERHRRHRKQGSSLRQSHCSVSCSHPSDRAEPRTPQTHRAPPARAHSSFARHQSGPYTAQRATSASHAPAPRETQQR